jgi:hypothetical protein
MDESYIIGIIEIEVNWHGLCAANSQQKNQCAKILTIVFFILSPPFSITIL